MKLIKIDPKTLKPNAWNPNVMSAEREKMLRQSIDEVVDYDPITCRQLDDGTLEILAGAHRTRAYIDRGDKFVFVNNLGKVGDDDAKKICLVDNVRYGENDDELLAALLETIEGSEEMMTYMPIQDENFDAFWENGSADLDSLMAPDDQDGGEDDKPATTTPPTHRVMRFKIANADAERLSEFIEKVGKERGFTKEDALTNAGDSLIDVIKGVW